MLILCCFCFPALSLLVCELLRVKDRFFFSDHRAYWHLNNSNGLLTSHQEPNSQTLCSASELSFSLCWVLSSQHSWRFQPHVHKAKLRRHMHTSDLTQLLHLYDTPLGRNWFRFILIYSDCTYCDGVIAVNTMMIATAWFALVWE